jgi:HEAT repeat protein
MLEDILYAWLVVRLLLSAALGVRAANRLRHDAATRAEFRRMVGFHLTAAGVTWVLEALIREGNMPVNGAPVMRVLVLPMVLIWTIWVPLVDTAGFFVVSAAVAAALARSRLARYRQELILGEPEQRVRAARACEFLGGLARPAVPELLEVVADPDPALRFRAARSLGRVNPREPAGVIDALRRALADADERVRLAAACALALLKQADPPVVAGAVAALAVADDDVCGEGLRAVWTLGAAAGAAGAEGVVGLADHWKFAGSVPMTLGRIGEPAVPALAVLLAHKSPQIRAAAATALGKLGPAAALAAPELEARLRDPSRNVQAAVRDALKAIRRAAVAGSRW